MPDAQKPLDPQADAAQADAAIARVKRLMAIATATTFVAVAAVLVVVGYRVFNLQGSAAPPAELAQAVAPLPAGARIVSSAVGDGRVVLTVEVGGGLELRSYDLETLKPLGRRQLR
jgi:hypothetical protein